MTSHAQHMASDPRRSVWVGASAGTGKTKVLTDRVLRLLLDGVELDTILCLTFTNAAAAEMASRIQRELGLWARLSEADLLSALTALLGTTPNEQMMQRARILFAQVVDASSDLRIQTIHGFCQMLIRRFPLESGVSPHFVVMDDRTSAELLEDARLHLFAHANGVVAESIEHLVSVVHPSRLTEVLKELFFDKQLLSALSEQFDNLGKYDKCNLQSILAIEEYETLEALVTEACETLDSMSKEGNLFDIMITQGTKTDQQRGTAIVHWLSLSSAQKVSEFDNYKALFVSKTDDTRPLQKLLTKGLQEKYPVLYKQLLDQQAYIVSVVERIRSWHIAHNSAHLLTVGYAILERYEQLKAQKSYLDYHDLVVIARDLLTTKHAASWVLYKLDGGVDHVLVDEAQDTSPEQWQVVQALCEEFYAGDCAHDQLRSLFVVGDEKQSIYSFQGADPQMFHHMQKVFSERVAAAKGQWKTVDLTQSFRSTEPVLSCVDAVFSTAEARQALTQDAGKPIEHTAYRSGNSGRVELWPVSVAQDVRAIEPWEPPLDYEATKDSQRALAEQIVERIAGWIKEQRILPAKGRPVEPGDIMILVRRRNRFVGTIVGLLKAASIPVAGVDRIVVTDHIAVMDLVALGNFLLLPEDDLTLATLLKSPLFNFDEEHILILSERQSLQSLWSSLQLRREGDALFRYAFETLSTLLNKADFLKPFDIFSYVLDVLNGWQLFAQRLGEEVYEPLSEFLNLAMEYEGSHAPSLQGFLHWIGEGSSEIKRDLDQESNAVRILTIHGAKGLQAPIVFLPDTTQVPNSRSQIFSYQHLDVPYILWSSGSQSDNGLCQALRQKQASESYYEYLRLLYVALTRAEDELYVAGYEVGQSLSDQSWYALIARALHAIGEDHEGVLRITSEQTVPVTKVEYPTDALALPPLPDYLYEVVTETNTVQSPLLQASHMQEYSSDHRGSSTVERGLFIHLLLEVLPTVAMGERSEVALGLSQAYSENFSSSQIEAMILEVEGVLNSPDLGWIFTGHSFAELPVYGTVGDVIVSGQIDRLVVSDEFVDIIDYKTQTRPPECADDVPRIYWQQMAVYQTLIAAIYPKHEVRCHLLWTALGQLMTLNSQTLNEISASDLETVHENDYVSGA